ncbi:pro-FMRFamide-related neuropeptide VF [Trichomycterus rosablanca]|uniref:pro-FMRFamide-related neuropeptide VF n=1 Tax=Trichomycterus rosablanca TaxID=2290929 RepID=UPI002F354326
MSCSALSLALGILSSLVFPDVSTVRPPLAGNSDINTITSRIFLKHNENLPRSLEMEDFALSVAPTSSRVDSPTILRLYPISAKPAHPHAILPLRFGRDSANMQRTPKSTINLPQRFGRRADNPSATLPQRFGRRNLLFGDPILILDSPSPRDRTQ